MKRILFLSGGPIFPHSIPFIQKMKMFSGFSEGFIVAPILPETKLVNSKIGKYTIFCFKYYEGNSVIRNILYVFNILKIVFRLKNTKIDYIISPNPLNSGLMALLLRFFLQAKVVIEVNGNFDQAFKYGRKGSQSVTFSDKIKDIISKYIVSFTLKRADLIKLVYSRQLKPLNIKLSNNVFSFPNFVPIQKFIDAKKKEEKYLLLLGFPWYLKGVDILIKAFNLISEKFTDYKLKIVGWIPEGKEYYEKLRGNNQNIMLCDAVEYSEVIDLMARCSIYILASRTDSSPRVLREAMAANKPIIASNIDGVPELIKDGYNGLLFESGNHKDLAVKIDYLLSNPEVAKEIADAGLKFVKENLSEEIYITNYKAMLSSVSN